LSAVQGAVLCGASNIFAIDISPERAQFAKQLGATHAIVSQDATEYSSKVRELTQGRGAETCTAREHRAWAQ